MSGTTNYHAMRFDPHPTQQMVDACCARIAELEASNNRHIETALTTNDALYAKGERIAELEAQLKTSIRQTQESQRQRDKAEAALKDCQWANEHEVVQSECERKGRLERGRSPASRSWCRRRWAEAALAGRRCEDCEACDHCSVQNAAWVRWGPEPDFACNRWAARAEEGIE